ncbi:ABC transporter substrate-binding protein [Methylobacterium nigriterrae]|uniref:ABC transporter substrate-binding protein n=1 Tax=Methylobacterium nigriterrae TaxID=3127512 RepID=UPI0030135A60
MKNWKRTLIAAATCTVLTTGAIAQISDDVVKIGVLVDMNGLYSDLSGIGSVTAARMAVEDFGGTVLGKRIEVVSADHQNKPDIGASITRQWIDREQVDVIVDVPVSSIAFAVQDITRQKNRVFLISSSGSSDLTGKACSPVSVHWTYDTYALSHATGGALLKRGADTWFFITADYAFGHALERDAMAVVKAAAGKVLGTVRHPQDTPDLSSFLLQAQASGAKVIALANAGGDTVNSIKQANEFGITQNQQIVGLLTYISDVHSLGLQNAQGLLLASAFYWDMTDETRAWTKRFLARVNKVPTMPNAGVYGAVTHYLKAIEAAGTDDATKVVQKMKELPINDFFTKNGSVREDGRVMRNIYLFQVKSPFESKYQFDYYKLVATIPAEQAFRPLSEGNCPLIGKATVH